jgi:hypothetical protein
VYWDNVEMATYLRSDAFGPTAVQSRPENLRSKTGSDPAGLIVSPTELRRMLHNGCTLFDLSGRPVAGIDAVPAGMYLLAGELGQRAAKIIVLE